MLKLLFLCLLWNIAAASLPKGANPKDLALYTPDGQGYISCGPSSSQKVHVSALNDDFCDCELTGLDEPGTSACKNGKFYCFNKGFEAKTIHSAFVNDGICDCCDGSDEYLEVKKCANTCKTEAMEAHKHILDEIEVLKMGLVQKKKLVDEAQALFEESSDKVEVLDREISALQKELEKLEELRSSLKKQKKALDKADGNDSSEEDEEEEQKVAEEVKNDEDLVVGETLEEHESFPYPKEYRYDPESQKENHDHDHHEDEENSGFEEHEDEEEPTVSHDDDDGSAGDVQEDLFKPKTPQNTRTTNEDEDEDDDEDDEADSDGSHGLFENIMSKALSLFGLIQGETQNTDYSDPANLVANIKQLRRQIKKMKSEIKTREGERDKLNEFLKKDLGPNHQFSSLRDSCFSVKIKQYEYEMCPFKDAKQKEGHSSTSLGTCEGWKEGSNYEVMRFSNGAKCWNGPHRSANVKFICGIANELLSVEEPSICAYEMVFKTPLACNDVQLELLQAKVQLH